MTSPAPEPAPRLVRRPSAGGGDGDPTRAPGRPRSPKADVAILRATLQLLGELGYRALSVEQVRARAGVGKTTIYRRYADKEELVRAAIAHLRDELPRPDTGSLHGDFGEIAEALIGSGQTLGLPGVVPRLLAESAHDPELQAIFYDQLVAPRRALVRAMLERSVARGEVRADVDLEVVVDLLAGALVYRMLIGGIPFEALPARAREVLELALSGLAPR